MAPSGLPISWATPAARRPTLASFSARTRRACSASRWSVIRLTLSASAASSRVAGTGTRRDRSPATIASAAFATSAMGRLTRRRRRYAPKTTKTLTSSISSANRNSDAHGASATCTNSSTPTAAPITAVAARMARAPRSSVRREGSLRGGCGISGLGAAGAAPHVRRTMHAGMASKREPPEAGTGPRGFRCQPEPTAVVRLVTARLALEGAAGRDARADVDVAGAGRRVVVRRRAPARAERVRHVDRDARRRGEVGLLRGHEVAQVRLHRGHVGLLLRVRELRDRDRRENADDHDHDQQLDQRETLARVLHHLVGPCSEAVRWEGRCSPSADSSTRAKRARQRAREGVTRIPSPTAIFAWRGPTAAPAVSVVIV